MKPALIVHGGCGTPPPGEEPLRNAACERAADAGFAVRADRAGNLVIGFPDTPADAPAVWCGSHIDSVPQGGNYDGLAGVVAGLLPAQRALSISTVEALRD